MIMDAQNRPSHNQSLVSGIGTLVSTDRIDLLTSVDSPGRSGMLRAVAVMTAALTSGGAATIQVQLVSTENSDGSSPTVLASGPVTALADAAAGSELLDVPLPDTDDRYLGFQYVIAGAAVTGGTITAGIVGGTDRPATNIPMNTGL